MVKYKIIVREKELVVAVPRFFVAKESISGSTVGITGDDARHISRVLRMKPGEELQLCDQEGTDYNCRVETLGDDIVTLKVESSRPSLSEPTVKITLFMALPKGDKMDYVIQKAVELGVYEIIPYSSSRCIVRLGEKDKQKKQERWARIALEAAKQSGRGIIPRVRLPVSFKEMLSLARESELPMLFYEKERDVSLKSILAGRKFQSASVIIGPEGGFEEAEVSESKAAGIPSVSLGARILRCETAPGCAICAIMYETDNI